MSPLRKAARLFGLSLVLACAKDGGELGGGPMLTVHWTGADTAAFTAPVRAERCDSQPLVQIRAISGDTGVGLVLFDSGTARAEHYPVRRPETADSASPAAAVALRWFAKTAVQGFQGDSGDVAVRRGGDGKLSGTFRAKARAINGTGRLELTGSFDEVGVEPAAAGCAPAAADSQPPSGDSVPGVD